MILMVIGGNKKQRQSLSKVIGASVPNTVVRRSIYQPIKTIVSDNDPKNKLTLIDKNLPYIGDTTDFLNHSDEELMKKIDAVKETFETHFQKNYMINHFNVGLAASQFFKNVASKHSHKPIFIIDDIERIDDLTFLYDKLKKLCIDSDLTIGKNIFSSINDLLKSGSGIDSQEDEKVRQTLKELNYYSKERSEDNEGVEPEILTIVIKDENNSISQVYPGATIKSMEDLSSYTNVIELNGTDFAKDSGTLASLIYNVFYKNEAKKQII
jgi:hypothetical protein